MEQPIYNQLLAIATLLPIKEAAALRIIALDVRRMEDTLDEMVAEAMWGAEAIKSNPDVLVAFPSVRH